MHTDQGERGERGEKGDHGQTGEAGPKRVEPIHPWRWRLLTVWILGTMFALGWIFHDLQQSRIQSCKKTYHAQTEIFRPFFPKNPATWTARQRSDWNKLLRTTNRLANGCGHQVLHS